MNRLTLFPRQGFRVKCPFTDSHAVPIPGDSPAKWGTPDYCSHHHPRSLRISEGEHNDLGVQQVRRVRRVRIVRRVSLVILEAPLRGKPFSSWFLFLSMIGRVWRPRRVVVRNSRRSFRSGLQNASQLLQLNHGSLCLSSCAFCGWCIDLPKGHADSMDILKSSIN